MKGQIKTSAVGDLIGNREVNTTPITTFGGDVEDRGKIASGTNATAAAESDVVADSKGKADAVRSSRTRWRSKNRSSDGSRRRRRNRNSRKGSRRAKQFGAFKVMLCVQSGEFVVVLDL